MSVIVMSMTTSVLIQTKRPRVVGQNGVSLGAFRGDWTISSLVFAFAFALLSAISLYYRFALKLAL